MDWREFNREAFEKRYKVFAFITKTEGTNFFSEKVWTVFDNCFAPIIEKSEETSPIYSMQMSSEKKGWLPLGRMTYQKTNLIKCIDKYKNHNNWRVFNTQIWSGNRKQIMDENRFPEFVFTVEYTSSKFPGNPVDNVLCCSFELEFYDTYKSLIDSSIEKFKNNIKYEKGFEFIRPWFIGLLSSEGVAGVYSRIAGVDGVLSSINLIDSETLNWNNKQCDINDVIKL